MKNLQTFEEFLNESFKPEEDVERGDIVTIYGVRQSTSNLGQSSFKLNGQWIGKKNYEIKIVVSKTIKYHKDDSTVISRAYFLDTGEKVPLTINYWYNREKGAGEKYLNKYEK